MFKNKASRSLDFNSPAVSFLFVWSLSPHLLRACCGLTRSPKFMCWEFNLERNRVKQDFNV